MEIEVMLLLLILSRYVAVGFSAGTLLAACETMTPSHGSRFVSQTTTPPYNISTDTCFTPGQSMTVILSGSKFKGFIMQARRPNDTKMAFGTFDVLGNENLGTVDCFQKHNSAVVHVNALEKTTVTVSWTAPPTMTGDIEIIATVLQVAIKYWVKALRVVIPQCVPSTSVAASWTESVTATGSPSSIGAIPVDIHVSVMFEVGLSTPTMTTPSNNKSLSTVDYHMLTEQETHLNKSVSLNDDSAARWAPVLTNKSAAATRQTHLLLMFIIIQLYGINLFAACY